MPLVQQLVRFATVLALVAVARPSLAQSPTTMGLDSEAVLVNKSVGDQQWAITRSFATRSVSGNVFTPGSDPQFVFCQQGQVVADVVRLACYGTGRCETSPCAEEWRPIASVALPLSFFAVGPPGEPGLEGLLGSWRLFDYEDLATSRERFDLTGIEDRAGRPTVVGTNEDEHAILVQLTADVDPGTASPYEFLAAFIDGDQCRFYSFNRTGDVLRGKIDVSATETDCTLVVATIQFEGARLSRVK